MPYYFSLEHTAPEVLSLVEAKKQLKMEDLGTFDDTIINDCVGAAILEAQNYINSSIFQAKWKINFNSWCQDFEPKKQKITSVDKITYKKLDDTIVVLSTQIEIDGFMELLPIDQYAAQLHFKDFTNLPNLLNDVNDAVSIEVTVGYGAGAVPLDLMQGIKLLLTDNYNFRNTRSRSKTTTDSSHILFEPYKYYM